MYAKLSLYYMLIVELLKIALFTREAIVGAAMLPENVRYGVQFATGQLVTENVYTGESCAALVRTKEQTFRHHATFDK